MKKLTITALLLLLAALPAEALSTKDILSLVAMPLAVAAVSDLAGVPQDQLADVVSSLNQANVPPTEFVQTVRYVPAALVVQPAPQEQTFAQWLASQDATGPALVTRVDRRLSTTYGVTPVINEVITVDDSYIPDVVVTRVQPLDPVAVAAMPLAVAAVSELTGVPQSQLADLAAALNQAEVPPTQFVQVVGYAPQTLVVRQQPVAAAQPAFVDFVRTQTQQGLRGPALAARIDDELPRYTVVNPHGGPPGQLKKQLGVQTGAEVVHGEKRGRQFVTREHDEGEDHEGRGHGRGHEVRAIPPPMTSAAPPVVVQPPQPVFMPPGQAKKEGGGDEHGNGKGQGKGKGHGKD